MPRLLQHMDVKALKVGGKKREPVGGRGDGSLMFWKRSDTVTEVYYIYNGDGEKSLKLGVFKSTKDQVGLSLSDARDKCFEYARLRRELKTDLKEHLETKRIERLAQEREMRLIAKQNEGMGTLEDLCTGYVESLRRHDKKDWKNVKNSLNRYVLTSFPHFKQVKARDIESDDIVDIISRMIEQGLTTTCNRVRSHLSAAFNYGIRSDHNPRERVAHGKKFGIKFNPVTAVPRQADFENVRERVLSSDEIHQLWYDFPLKMPKTHPIYGLMLRFMFACAGNRPRQLSRCKWSDFDLQSGTFSFMEYKGRSGEGIKRVMPLSPKALDVVIELKKLTGDFDWVFSIRGKVPISDSRLANEVKAFYGILEEEAKQENRTLPEPYTPKDIRRTVTKLLIDARIPKEQRFLLQSRRDGSVESKHYDHSDRLEEKYDSLLAYDELLDQILKGENPQVINLGNYRRRAG